MKTVDIFKEYKCNELKNIQGKVFMKQDKILKRRVIQLDGNVTTAAVLKIDVNLLKNYLHFQINVNPQSIFMINITMNLFAKQSYRLSISNLYKLIKYPQENCIQIPCEGQPWFQMTVDCKSFCKFAEIVQITISGAISVKNIYNSKDEQLNNEQQLHNSNKQVFIRAPQHQKENKAPAKGILKQKLKYEPKLTELEEERRPEERLSPVKLEQVERQIQEIIEPPNFTNSPLMVLEHIHGYSPSSHSANLLYLDNAYFAYPCGKTIVIMSQETLEQKFFSTNMPITSIAKYNKQLLIGCEENGKEGAEIVQLDYITCRKNQHYKLEGYRKILVMSILDNIVVICALDHQNRYALLYLEDDIIQIKQISSFQIQQLKLKDKNEFISVGKENIRYWSVRKETHTFIGHTPYLGNYARETHFTDLLIQDKRVLACCKSGRVFQFIDQELIGVWQVADSAISSMSQFESFIVTTHGKGLKYWKNDFTEVMWEIKTEIEIVGCDSRQYLICGFKDKSIGRIKDQQFEYLVHSHQQDVLDLVYVGGYIVSSAMDHRICVWNQELKLEYQFRCLDALTKSLCGFESQVLAGFDNGMLRVFDLQKFQMVLEMDTKAEILCMASSKSIVLVCQDSETLILNHKLLIIKTLKVRHPFQCGFNQELFYIASKDYIKLYSLETLNEIYHLNIPLNCVDINNSHIVLVTSDGHLKRFDMKMNFLQEVVTNATYVTTSSNYVFSSNLNQLHIYDYSFKSNADCSPFKQVYNQKVSKLIINQNQIISFSDDYIFIWRAQLDLGNSNAPYIEEPLHPLQIDVKYDQNEPQSKKIQRDPTKQQQQQQQQNKTNEKQKSPDKKQSPDTKSPKKGSPLKSPPRQLVIEDQIPKLKFKRLHGYSFGKVISQIAWNKKSKFYVLPADLFMSINYYAQQEQLLILTDQIISIHQYCNGILSIHPSVIQIFTLEMEYVKSIPYHGQILCAAVSLCGNYMAMIIENKIQILELSSGRILTQSLVQIGIGECYIEWCSKQDLMFTILTGISTQLWRVNQRSLLEYCDVEVPKHHFRSSSTLQIEGRTILFIGQGTQLILVDIRQGRQICQVDNVSQQEIIQVVCSQHYLILLTNSPNIYYYKLDPQMKQIQEKLQIKADIVSLDSKPLGYSEVDSDMVIATRAYVWYVDFRERVTIKIQTTIPPQQKALALCQEIIGTSEGTILLQDDEILVPKRQCTGLGYMSDILVCGFDDGLVRLFKDYQLIGQIKVGLTVTALFCMPTYFIVGNDKGIIYYCTGKKEILMQEIQNAEFEISSLDVRDQLIGYSSGNQKVQILHRKQNEELNIIKPKQIDNEQLDFYLMDTYRFRSIEKTIMEFSKSNKELVIMASNNVVIRNFIEHVNIYIIETQCSAFLQYDMYLVIGRKDGSVSLYDSEIELDKQIISLYPIHMMKGKSIAFSNMKCDLL